MATAVSLFSSIKAGDAEAVREALRENPELGRATLESGETPFLLAKYYGQDNVIAALLASGVEPDLYEATALGMVDRVRAVVEADFESVNSFSPDGFTPLQLAAYFGHPEIAEFLLSRRADVSPVSRHPMQVTAIHACVASGNASARLPIARALLDAGAEVNAKHPGGFSPLHAAAQNGDRELAKLLLDRGAIPNAVTEEGKTPLDYARDQGHSAVAELLESVSGVTA